MSSVMPTAVPGLLRKVPGMLLDPAGPLSVRWRHLPRLAPWLIAFLRNTTRNRVEANSHAIAALIHGVFDAYDVLIRSEEHTSELQSLMRISYAVFCLKKKTPKSGQKPIIN